MKRMMILILCFFASSLYAGGETGLAVLKIGAGARASAMGEAFVALSDDASGVFWNPSGSVWINKRQAHFTYNSWIQGIHHNVAALTFPTTVGSFGIGLLLNTVDGFERRTIASEEPLGTFSAHDFSLLLNYSRQFNRSLSVGLNLKYINEKIYLDNANGYMVDLGVRYASPLSGLFFAAAWQNAGYSTKMGDETLRLPQTLRCGMAYRLPFKPVPLILVGDYVNVIKEDDYINLGSEVKPLPALALRLGYQMGYEEKGLSSGFGLDLGKFSIDYAYVPFGQDLGDSHRFSVTTIF